MGFRKTNQDRVHTYEFDFLVEPDQIEFIRVGYHGDWNEALAQLIACNVDERFTMESFAAVKEIPTKYK